MNAWLKIVTTFLVTCGLPLSQSVVTRAAQDENLLPQHSSPAQSFKIAGTVVNAITGAPLAQARVILADTKNPRKMASVVTAGNGHFEFSSIPPGKYALDGAKSGFIPSAYQQHEQFSTAIVTGPEFSTENLTLQLTPAALISGHVFDESGDGIRTASVVLYIEDHGGGMTRIRLRDTAMSDDRGYFDFSQLRPGKYFLAVTAKPWYSVHPPNALNGAENAPPSPGSTSLDVTYPTTYYSGATETTAATPIEVKGGDRLAIDAHLNPEPALHLIFRIPQDNPEEQNNVSMPMLQKQVFDSEQPVSVEGMHSVAPGVFEITGVPPGQYTVRILNPKSDQWRQATEMDLEHDGQELSVSPGDTLGSVKVTLQIPGDEELPKEFAVGLQDSHGKTVRWQPGNSSSHISFDDLTPGQYALLINSPTGRYSVVNISSPAGESAGHEVDITPGAALEVTATLMAGVVSIEGVVHKKDKPLAGIMVALIPKDHPENHIELFRRDQSDFDGTFLLPAIIPGSYTIVAVEDAWGFEWLQPGVLARYAQHGQELTIGEHMRGSVHLPDPVEAQPR